MKLLLVGWYHLINPIITAKNYFEILGYEVYFLPLLSYNQKYSGEQLYNALYTFINNIDPNIILWWNWECPKDVILKIKKNTQNILHCLFNWDHPFCLSEWDNKHNRKITEKNIWDICFVTGDEKLEEYTNSGSKEAYYLRMFADKEIHYPEVDKKYECDVSIVCTNYYDDKIVFSNTIISRKQLIKDLIDNDINLRIYGSENLKEDFPNNYYGFSHFLDNHKVFTNSRINLCTHVTDGYKYFNERVGTILSSGGLLFCDKINGIEKVLTNNHDCILIDENNYVNQVKEILSNYPKYENIKKNAVETARKKFSPEHWAKFIDKKIKEFIKKHPTKGLNKKEDNKYDFHNYQKGKVSIVMTYFNRIQQVTNTLDTIEESKYSKNLIEVILYDDRSDIEKCILDLSKYSYNIKIIHAEYERDEKIINSTYSYNNAFKYINGEYIIIQNSECMHIGDIISYTVNNLSGNNLISFPCWATGNEELSEELFNNRNNKNKLIEIIDTKWNELNDYPSELKGWYNHKILRPQILHFCNAMHIDTFKKVGIFNTKCNEILGFDDNEYSERISFQKNIELEIPDHNYNLFAVHQYHGKYNKPRPDNLFLNSSNKFRIIDNYRKNNNDNNNKNEIFQIKYTEINKDTFINQLNNEWSFSFVYVILNMHEYDIDFLRKCLKCCNFLIILKK